MLAMGVFTGAQVQGARISIQVNSTFHRAQAALAAMGGRVPAVVPRAAVNEFEARFTAEQLAQMTFTTDLPAQSSGCFIATACYGSYDAPEVLVLRRFRDEELLPSRAGRLAVGAYYRVSPPIAHTLERSPRLRRITRMAVVAPLARAVSRRSCPPEESGR
jgi:hypothetical protein